MDGATLKAMLVSAGAAVQAPAPASRLQSKYASNAVSRRLRPKHKLVILMNEMGYTNVDISAIMGYSTTRVASIIRWDTPETQALHREFRDQVINKTLDVQGKLQAYAPEMVDIVVKAARDPDLKIARLAARDILHMAGYQPVKRVMNLDIQVPKEEFVQAVERMSKQTEVEQLEGQWRIAKVETPQRKEA